MVVGGREGVRESSTVSFPSWSSLTELLSYLSIPFKLLFNPQPVGCHHTQVTMYAIKVASSQSSAADCDSSDHSPLPPALSLIPTAAHHPSSSNASSVSLSLSTSAYC